MLAMLSTKSVKSKKEEAHNIYENTLNAIRFNMIRRQQKEKKKKMNRMDSINTSTISFDDMGQTTFLNAGFTVNQSPGTSMINGSFAGKISQNDQSQKTPKNLRQMKKGQSFAPTSKRLLEKSQTVSGTWKKE